MAAAGFWTVLGLYADLSWHIRNHVDTFFTLQHSLLYSGLAALFFIALLYRRQPGARVTFAGVALFAAGGAADLIKHQVFGIEHDFDALVSPTHLALGFGVALAVCAPVRSALRLSPPATLGAQWPMLTGMASFVELLHWVTNPFFRLNAAALYGIALPHQLTANALTLQTLRVDQQGGGLIAMLLQALLIAGPLLYAVARFRLATGSLTILCVLGTILIAFSNAAAPDESAIVLAAAIAAGVTGDLLLWRRVKNPASFAVLPVLAFDCAAVGITALTQGTWWDASFALGAIAESCAFAFFLSLLASAGRPANEPA